MKKLFVIAITGTVLAIAACGDQSNSSAGSGTSGSQKADNGNPSYDPQRGIGKFTKVDVGEKLDAKLADEGNKTYSLKCMSCHKLTNEKLVGPGWKGVTQRKSAEWIMNFSTNTDEMLNKDPEAQAQLELCLVRMPNQNLSDDEARHVYEFMRKNDGVQ
jgi:cytochrome c551/c552